ncbi:type 2 lanthipeptide synthetase LanM family protein [Microcoleus sp.]|uniref:type 2 lanthipeptide synthetase LanM family protein n=1 Tax=Microcoleus sp. TaxID=44472 RepID=UPI0035941CD2
MDRQAFQGESWYRAIPLSERIASLGAGCKDEFDGELADRRLQRWRSQYPLTKDTFFDNKLALEGISEAEFRYLLGEPVSTLAKRHGKPLSWLEELDRAFMMGDRVSVAEQYRAETEGFTIAIAPLVAQGKNRLRQGIAALVKDRKTSSLPFDRTTIESILLAFLPDRLFWMLNPTMALELNAQRLQGLLAGETPQQRFQSFLQRLQDPESAITLLEEYPVLAQQIVICINSWVDLSLEFLQRLCDDWETIISHFSLKTEVGVLAQVKAGAGDAHNGGRSVTIVKFSSGWQIAYKPKPLAVDDRFQELLTWLNTKSELHFRTLQILDRGSYGWVEFAHTSSCDTTAAVERFYQRLGGLLALLHAIQGTDFHAENLIAAGEHPVLIDLESLFHPHPVAPNSPNSVLPARREMGKSVLRVGLLPQPQAIAGDAVDVSAIGGNPERLGMGRTIGLKASNTDEAKVFRQAIAMAENQNQPRLQGELVNALEYSEAIATGFTATYRLIVKHREEFSNFLTRFATDEVRVFLRETRSYGLLLQESFHPNLLRDALDRDRIFDKLWVEVPALPYLERVIPTEREALWQGDIPKLTTYPNSRHLWASNGECFRDFFDESGLELVQQRLQAMNEADLERQLWFIRTSLTTLGMVVEPGKSVSYAMPKVAAADDRAAELAYVQAASAIGDRLEYLAVQNRDLAGWIGPVFTGTRHWAVSPLGWDLWDGIPGVALFLAYLGAVTKQDRYRELAQAGMRSVLHQVEYEGRLISSIGAFNGWAGLIYTLTHLGILWQQPELLSMAVEWVERLPELISKDEQLDIIGGAAGCIGALASLHCCVGGDRIKTVALRCGDRILEKAEKMPQGLGWRTIPGCQPLTGFSHGAAGIAWALLELATLTGAERFHEAAVGAIAYERSLFSEKVKNWPDLRFERDRTQFFSLGWSHGAPGIGFGRLHSLRHFQDGEILAEIEVARETAIARGFGGNHSLCNGDLGNLEFLNSYQQMLDNSLGLNINHIATNVLESIRQYGWICDVPQQVENLGLMTGIAGIGYGFLRLAAADIVPSVLAIAPPFPSRGSAPVPTLSFY